MTPTISSFFSSLSHTAANYTQANSLAHSSSAAGALAKITNDAKERSDIGLNPMLGAGIAGMSHETPSIAQSNGGKLSIAQTSGGPLGSTIDVYA